MLNRSWNISQGLIQSSEATGKNIRQLQKVVGRFTRNLENVYLTLSNWSFIRSNRSEYGIMMNMDL